MPATPTKPGQLGPEPQPPRRRTRLYALALTPIVIATPLLSGALGYALSGDPYEWDVIAGASIVFAAICALAWAGFGLHRLAAPIDRTSAKANDGVTVEDQGVIRTLLTQHDLVCAKCGYNLRGLPPGPCPECREPIRLRISSNDPLRRLSWVAWLCLAACTARAASGLASLVSHFQQLGFSGFPPSLRVRIWVATGLQAVEVLSLFAMVVPVIAWIRARGPMKRTRARWRIAIMGATVLALVALLELVSYAFWWLW